MLDITYVYALVDQFGPSPLDVCNNELQASQRARLHVRNVDIDQTVNDFRYLQLTPNGSKCSIHLRRASADRPAGSVRDLFLVVRDVRAARGYLVEQGLDIGEVQVFDSGDYRPARPGESLDMVGCAFFNDPDDNSWCVQQIPPRD